jgi:CBS-domain-containing membrane protein
VTLDTPVPELFGLLSTSEYALPVLDEQKRLQGVVFKAGVLKALAHDAESSREELPGPTSPQEAANG